MLIVSDTGYWLAEIINNDVVNVFESGDDFIEHLYTLYDVTNTHTHLFDLEKIQNIFILRIFNEDLGDVKEEDINANAFDEKDFKEISFDNLKAYSDSNIDAIYIMRLKRISKLF